MKMIRPLQFILLICLCVGTQQQHSKMEDLPSLYEYYTQGGVESGLLADTEQFTLNGRNITLYSAGMHYFRVPSHYWRDRLRKIRAAGLNAVETYIAWNLHEPEAGQFDFGKGGSDMQDFLDLDNFFKIAKEEDLLVIVRPGPYICAEWDFGGMPSWLMRSTGIKVRTNDPKYMIPVKRYYDVLIPILAKNEFTNGGSIIASQIENEYWSIIESQFDREYLKAVQSLTINNGFKGLLFTSDAASYVHDINVVPGALVTANFGGDPKGSFDILRQIQPNRPVMSMEFYTGWLDHWSENKHTSSGLVVANDFRKILKYPGSVNFYMFHGGTNFAFLNGANDAGGNTKLQPTITSYDYDAPLTEAGDYTAKYNYIADVIKQYVDVKTRLPERPPQSKKTAYPAVTITHWMQFKDIADQSPHRIQSKNVVPMEMLPINNNNGQSYGYIVYRKKNIDIQPNTTLKIEGHVHDTVMVLINGNLYSKPMENAQDWDGFGYWRLKDSTLNLGTVSIKNATLELVVENWGRINFGNNLDIFDQRKGIWEGNVLLNNNVVNDWEIIPLEFKTKWNQNLQSWNAFNPKDKIVGPAMYKGTFEVTEVTDTFVDVRKWMKGFIIVNGFVLGRYCNVGPQYTLYLPAPFLKNGSNEIIFFEHFKASDQIEFSDENIFT